MMRRLFLAPLAMVTLTLGVLTLTPTAARAQVDVTRSPSTAPTLGMTIRGSSATTFSISTSGVVTRTAGDAIRMGGDTVTVPTIYIDCGLLNLKDLCALRRIRVRIQPAGGSGPATITRFRVGNLQGTSFSNNRPTESASVTFDLQPIGVFGGASFNLGMDVVLQAGAASGQHTFNYTVTAELM